MRRLKYMGTGERLDTSINPFNPRLRKVKCLTRRMRSVSTCCSSCFASEENDLITLSTPEVASEGEVNSRSEKDVQEPRQPTVLEGGQQVPSMAYATRHNCMDGRLLWFTGSFDTLGCEVDVCACWLPRAIQSTQMQGLLRLCSPKWLLSLN